jgi:thioredoxin 1
MGSSNIVVADDSSFDQLVRDADRPILIKFSSQHCPPCRALAPIIDRIADENVGKVQVLSVDVDAAPRVATRYGIRAVPTLLAFRGGAPRGQLVGLASRDAVLKLLA